MKRLIAMLLALVMVLSLAACGKAQEDQLVDNDSQRDGQIMLGQEGLEVEVNEAEEHLDSAEACNSGNWEAMFVPVEVEGRANNMLDVDLTPTAEELEAMKAEPAYGKAVMRYQTDGCSSPLNMADYLGYYAEAGLTTEVVKGNSYTEALGTNHAQVAIGHIATMLVPITNGVDLTCVGGIHIACKSLYVLADSPYKTTEDLKGTNIAVPNGIGASDYNITSLMLDDDGINPQTDVTLVQVSADASVSAMENGEISAVLLTDTYAYGMVKDGKLRCISSMLDSDYSEVSVCCAIAMNRTFVQENPVHAKKITQAIQKAGAYMRANPEDATDILLEQGWNAGDREMNIMINKSLQYGMTAENAGANLREIVERYIRLGLISSMDNADEVMELAWIPCCD